MSIEIDLSRDDGGGVDCRPLYILASRAQALDRVQELILPSDADWPDAGVPLPTREQWDAIVEAAFPPPPMAENHA